MEKDNKKPIRRSTYDHVLKYTGLFGGVQGLTILITIVRSKLVAILLGSAGIGLIDIYNRTLDLLSNSTNFGISFSAVRNVSALFEEGDQKKIEDFCTVVRTWSTLTALLGMFVCITLSPLISYLSFGDYSFMHIFCLLSPIVAFLAICGGELAILKGMRRLKRVAFLSGVGALTTFLTTIPLYSYWGAHGIVPALLLSTASITALHLYYTQKVMPWHISLFRKDGYGKGAGLIKLGVPYILAGIMGSGVDVIVRLFFNEGGESLSTVGLYAAGFTLTKYYGQMVFKALDSDYFPRLSAVSHDTVEMNYTINQQLKVCVMLIAPFLVLFMLMQPLIVPMLYTEEFALAIPMIICASPHIFFKALSLPIAYTSLAKGDSVTYLVVELIYDVAFCLLTIVCYQRWGLIGAGVALSVAYLIDLVMVTTVNRYRYGFRLSGDALRFSLVQALFLGAGLFCALQTDIYLHYGMGGAIFLISLLFSYRMLKRESTIIDSIRNKLIKKRRK